MLWPWWAGMFAVGLIIGAVAAWATGGRRFIMSTLAAPVTVVLSRLLLPDLFPIKNSPLYVFIDLIVIAAAAITTDYLVGLKLGRNDRAGYRGDSVGH